MGLKKKIVANAPLKPLSQRNVQILGTKGIFFQHMAEINATFTTFKQEMTLDFFQLATFLLSSVLILQKTLKFAS